MYQLPVTSYQLPARKIITVLLFSLLVPCALCLAPCLAQQGDEVEVTIDVNANTIPLPKIFRPTVDVSGRGFYPQYNWPQGMAAAQVIDTWQKDIGFNRMYRLQYSLWEVYELSKYKETQEALQRNYEGMIKKISEAGGIVILDIFGTPAGLGKVLDKKSPPFDLKAYKELIKTIIRNLSCEKRYNIWYEVWNAPDLDTFFLGRRQEYLNLYRVVAEAIKELEVETKIQIPLGGPGVSWWFQTLDGNTIATPERSLIYELIKFCYHYRLPLNFISWHAYSTDPKADQDITIYKKSAASLIRDWLTYFHFDYNIPLIVSEWNFDSGANIVAERYDKSYVTASYIPSRLKHMYDVGIDYGIYYCLEDFQNNVDGVARNVGLFWFDSNSKEEYRGVAKASYNVFRMLSLLENRLYHFSQKTNDDFVTAIATKGQDTIAVLLSNYIDPQIANNYVSRSIATLSEGERKILLNLIKTKKFDMILQRKLELSAVSLTRRLRALLKKTQEVQERATKMSQVHRAVKISIKNLKDTYSYERFVVEPPCGLSCEWKPAEEKEVLAQEVFQETLTLKPYSVHLIILKKKPKEAEKAAVVPSPGQLDVTVPVVTENKAQEPELAPREPAPAINETESPKPKE